MSTFLIVVSVILNMLSILAIVILYLRQNRLLQFERDQKRAIKEIEEVFSAYLLEMKEENEQFITRLKKLEKEQPVQQEETNSAVTAEDSFTIAQRVGKVSRYQTTNAYKKYGNLQQEEISLPPLPINEERNVEGENVKENGNQTKTIDIEVEEEIETENPRDSLINQVIELKREGYQIEEIAQKLNKGKTEIELLIKFQENK
jgi:hypothetical protein